MKDPIVKSAVRILRLQFNKLLERTPKHEAPTGAEQTTSEIAREG